MVTSPLISDWRHNLLGLDSCDTSRIRTAKTNVFQYHVKPLGITLSLGITLFLDVLGITVLGTTISCETIFVG